jgi:hypothetical protein
LGEIFRVIPAFEVGDGSKISFWHDQWCGDVPLKEAFSNFFGIAHAKDVLLRLTSSFMVAQTSGM